MQNILDIKKIQKSFGGLHAVQGYNLQLEKNKILGLIGPNGAGKTTLFNLITGILKPDSGSILFLDHELVGLRPDQIAIRGISRTFQLLHLYETLTVEMNLKIAYHMHLKYNLIESILGLNNYIKQEKKANEEISFILNLFKMERYRHMKALTLPYGLQRKLDIAQCLISKPSLLLLDEPCCGMNDKEVEELSSLIKEIRERFSLTMIIVEHRVPFIMGLAEQIQVLDHGIVIAEGLPDEIKNNEKVIEAYFGGKQHVTSN
jgi:branched-chain amino acid transport system ATP-binding protein